MTEVDPRPAIAELFRTIVSNIVDNPGDVVVDYKKGEQTTVVELKVAKSDVGKVIGKQGRMAQSLRNILIAVSTKNQMRAVLEILE